MSEDKLVFFAWCVTSIAFAELFGFSKEAGLFGAIIVGGMHIIDVANARKTKDKIKGDHAHDTAN